MDDVITLISVTKTQNDYGVWEFTPTRKDVFCQVQSVTRAEFFEGGRNGLNPSFVFRVFVGDYDGETICEYQGKQYSIYRTYITNGEERTFVSNTRNGSSYTTYHTPSQDYIELYVERKGGTNA